MKDQYVGDINDFVKYSVLRAVQEVDQSSLLVCWMLTEDDGSADGRRIGYLSDPATYRNVDPALFDGLRTLVASGARSTQAIEAQGVLPGAAFYRRRLYDGDAQRRRFMASLHRSAAQHRVLFLDPDNGLDVASTPYGRSGSRRYVYCAELAALQELELAVIVYQHFPRVPRDHYVGLQLKRLADALPGFTTCAIRSSSVAFLSAAPPGQHQSIEAAFQLASNRWQGRLTCTEGHTTAFQTYKL